MIYEVKKPILGFETIHKVEFEESDEIFLVVKDVDSDLSFSVVNPYSLLEDYSFDISKDVQVLLDIKEDSKLLVYNIVVLNKKLSDVVVNFKAPLIFNKDNQRCAQTILDDYDVAVRIGDLIKEEK